MAAYGSAPAENELREALAFHISQEIVESQYFSLQIRGPGSILTQLEHLQYSVCLEGEAGSGKTTFAWYSCHLWAQGQLLKNMKAVVVVDIAACLDASSLEHVLLPYSKKLCLSESTKTWLESLIKCNREQVLLIFDGVEKLSQGSNDSRFAYKFLVESVQHRAPVLLLGQPGTMDLMSQFHIRIESPFEVLGFESTEIIMEYVSCHVTQRVFRSVEEYMRDQQWVQHLCRNPRMASILVESLKEDPFFLREAKTAVLHSLLLKFVAAECPNCSSAPSLFQLPGDAGHIFRYICHISFVCTLMGNELQELDLSHINLNEGVSSLTDLGGLGLVYRVGNRIQFLSEAADSATATPTMAGPAVVKLFLSAFHVSLLSLSEQVDFYCENRSSLLSSLSLISTFLFGLGRLNHHGKLALGSAVECLAQHVQLEQGTPEKNLVLLCCIQESQEISLIRSLIAQFPDLTAIELPKKISKDEQSAISFMITHSGIKEWHIESPTRESADELAFYLATSLSEEVKISIAIKKSLAFAVKPASDSMPVAKKSESALAFVKHGTTEYEKEELFKHAVQCNAQREALHRVFNLYSKVKLRSDAGDPAYLSFITCRCVEEKLHGEVVLGPIHPVLSVKLAAKNKEAETNEAEREAARRHIEEEHDQCYTEIIVLSKPYPKSLTFQPQESSETCQLVLSTDKLPSCMAGRIAMEVRESILDNRHLVQCATELEEQRVKKKEIVTHGLPLPKSKSRNEAEKANVLPGELKGDRKKSGEGLAAGSDMPAMAAQVAPSHPYKNLKGDEPLFSPVPAQTESSEKITWRPGMIMYTDGETELNTTHTSIHDDSVVTSETVSMSQQTNFKLEHTGQREPKPSTAMLESGIGSKPSLLENEDSSPQHPTPVKHPPAEQLPTTNAGKEVQLEASAQEHKTTGHPFTGRLSAANSSSPPPGPLPGPGVLDDRDHSGHPGNQEVAASSPTHGSSEYEAAVEEEAATPHGSSNAALAVEHTISPLGTHSNMPSNVEVQSPDQTSSTSDLLVESFDPILSNVHIPPFDGPAQFFTMPVESSVPGARTLAEDDVLLDEQGYQ